MRSPRDIVKCDGKARNAAGMVAVTVSDEDYTGGETTAGTGNWNGATLTKDTNTLVVYTDIEAPSDKLLTLQYDAGRTGHGSYFYGRSRVTSVRVRLSLTASPLNRERDLGCTLGKLKMVGVQKQSAGTFDGVPGHFSCEADATCTLMTDADGKLISAGD